MVEIKRFSVLSVGIIYGILSAVGGLFAGLFMAGWFSLIAAVSSAYGSAMPEDFGSFGWIFGGIGIVIFPIMYGAFGFVAGIITAALYNLFVRWVGGVKVEISQIATTEI